jgi:hypothetical protein
MSKAITPEQLASSGSEDAHQMALFAQAALHFEQHPMLRWMHAIPNGGYRNDREASKLVGTGTRAGVFDIFLPHIQHRNRDDMIMDEYVNYAGLYIEMKRPDRIDTKNGGLTDEQIKFMTYAVVAGYKCVVAYSWQQAWDEIVNYLKGG